MNKATEFHKDDIQHDDNRHNEMKNGLKSSTGNGTQSPEQIEHEIDQARARVSKTLNELSARLSPGELIDQALDMAREHGGDFGRNLGAQVKNNPIPMILTSIGISWMMLSGNPGAPVHAASRDRDKDGRSIKNALGATAGKTRDKAAAVGDHMHTATANVKESAQHARDSLVQFYRDQPLLAGSLGIAMGAALGALVPSTETEDDMFGEASDRSVDAAKSQAVEMYDEVRESV